MSFEKEPIAGSLHEKPFLMWADCEFTGLELAEGHKIIEIGAMVTDLSLNEIETYGSFVQHDWNETEKLMGTNPWWDDRAADKLRMQQGVTNGTAAIEVDSNLANLVEEYFGNFRPPLCGNSVHSDRKHIDVEFPRFSSRLDYRIVDVTSLKILAAKYRGVVYDQKKHNHYAIDDIRESIDELRFLLKELGIVDLAKLASSKE